MTLPWMVVARVSQEMDWVRTQTYLVRMQGSEYDSGEMSVVFRLIPLVQQSVTSYLKLKDVQHEKRKREMQVPLTE